MLPSYISGLKTHYSAEPMMLNFDPSSAAASVAAVNKWVSGATDGAIDKMVDKADVSEDTR